MRFDKSSGLLSDSIRTLHLDSHGVLWIGTTGGGLSRWSEKRITNFTTHEGLPDNTISQILEDDTERLWLGCNRGVVCIRKQEVEELAAGKIAVIYPQTYGRAEGMVSEECSSGFFPAGLKTKSGLLWFSTLKGVVAVDPRPYTAPSSPPTVLLEEVLLDGNPAPSWHAQSAAKFSRNEDAAEPNLETSVLRIPPGRHMLELRYTGLSFTDPDRVRFRYRLEGLDSDWVEAGGRRTGKRFPNPRMKRCALSKKLFGQFDPEAIRCKVSWNTSRILRTSFSPTRPHGADSICLTICRLARCRQRCGTIFF